jgi:hypothetical protein
VSTCPICNRRVTLVRHAGRDLLLDEDPNRRGNIVVGRTVQGPLEAHVYPTWEEAIEAHPFMPRYVEHECGDDL